ncbi:WD40-repeat-containing domain protein [Pterulicium gracile]|uniref:ASTRA-associated protein 1 n=1 Tax=Pterulicium gracile TaxID=1884261 RepID=A0A5C3QBS9_9AGAR|nr:WD40-repeat-containing domain protein [Pterula gracilis]
MPFHDPPPLPRHILRHHRHPVSSLHISRDNERIYSADSSGLVAVTSTRTIRPIAKWQAHKDSVLGIQEWGDSIITHARDNKIHVWTRITESPPSASIGASAALPDLPVPDSRESTDVNALNFCRFSLLDLGVNLNATLAGVRDPQTANPQVRRALIAVPNLVQSELADIWAVPGFERLHAAIGTPEFTSERGTKESTGISMALHLFTSDSLASTSSDPTPTLNLLSAYENGSVQLRRYTPPRNNERRRGPYRTIEGRGWQVTWSYKAHNETVMGMSISLPNTLALTVSADHLIGRYDLAPTDQPTPSGSVHRTKHPGNSAITIHDDGKLCAVGSWDGRVRLFSTRSLKALGTLSYHKESCQAVAFAHPLPPDPEADVGEEEEEFGLSVEEKSSRSRWLVAGGKDGRVSVWELKEFAR